ncbi:MAG: carboxypeptidase-like regulatory domain-containing protein [Gelidibacter sp.]
MKIQSYILWALFLLCSTTSFSQQIRGQIIDAKTSEPIAFATIQYAEDKGVVSNMEGFFNMSSEDLNPETILTFSFMGYQTQTLTIKHLQDQNNLVKLNEAVNQLNTVYITNKLPSVDSIMARVNRNLVKNYQFSNLKQTLFTRETMFFKANKLEVDIEKSSGFNKKQLEESNKQFRELANQIVHNPPTQTFTDVLWNLYLKPDLKSKMEVIKATKLKDRKNNLSLETIQSRVSNIVLQHLDTSKTYKVKTGWFKIEDSLSLKKSKEIKKDLEDNSFNHIKSGNVNNIMEHLFESQSMMDFVKDTDIYDYELVNVTTIDDHLVYIIDYEPRKNRAKFKGTIYVAEEDYAILKMDYSYSEGKVGEKLNLKLLLGVKYVENVNKGTVIYKKDEQNNNYYPYYINHQSGQYVYAHRPFKFTENSDDSKNKVAFDVTIEGNVVEKYEVMSLDYKPSDEATFNGISEANKIEFIQLKQYDPSIWKDYNILEPLEELKKFKVEE